MNLLVMRQHAARAGMGELGAEYNLTNNLPPGYTKDYSGNIIDPSGTIIAGPDVKYQTRPLLFEASTAGNTQLVTLANGQQVLLTAAQYQQYLATQGAAPGSLIASGLGTGFSSFAAQFGVSPTTLILLFVVGAYLLFKPPPTRR